MTGKIFCLGFQKTGTSSLAKALKGLGFTVGSAHVQLNKRIRWDSEDLDQEISEMVLNIAKGVDVLEDSPCPFLFQELDEAFPHSRFILTERDSDSWLQSYQNYFPDRNNPLRRWMYGVDRFSGNEATYRALFERQNAKIKAHFTDRQDDFLVMNLPNGDGWPELVNFLGKDFLKPFPHANKTIG